MRYAECVTEKNCALIRYDILQDFRNLYDAVKDEAIYRTRSQIALFQKVESAICDRGYYKRKSAGVDRNRGRYKIPQEILNPLA